MTDEVTEKPTEHPSPPRKPRRGFLVAAILLPILVLGFLFVLPQFLPVGRVHPELNASSSLRTLYFAEQDLRMNDRDGNGKQDFWTGDVASLYSLAGKDGARSS